MGDKDQPKYPEYERLANEKSGPSIHPEFSDELDHDDCLKIRDDKNSWQEIESYVQDNSEAEFSHGVCPNCLKERYPDLAAPGRPSDPG